MHTVYCKTMQIHTEYVSGYIWYMCCCIFLFHITIQVIMRIMQKQH